ncbi:IclR family transcriptional regulator [Gordonia sp. NPDC127522]|uniref:IclR family transcriptional regulator n=1 Tax=Gordonia sp. NPDC127522 TaxID=3345390 RepID=UPI00363E88AE
MSSPDSDSGPGVLNRASLILDALAGGTRLSLADLVRRTGLPRSSVHRMLERLVALRILEREGNTYRLGLRLVELGSLALQQDSIRMSAAPYAYDLHRTTGMIAHVGVLDGTDVVYLEKVGGQFGPKLPTRPGVRLPAEMSALGRILLAYDTSTDADWSSRSASELSHIRESGIAYERGDSVHGFSCVAVPIGPPGAPVAGISLCGPSARMSRMNQFVSPLRMAAAGAWHRLDRGVRSSAQLSHARLEVRSTPSRPFD